MQKPGLLPDRMRINVAGLSDIGQLRMENEDHFVSYSSKDWPFAYLVVADGMGGYYGGALASKIAADIISTHLHGLPTPNFINAQKDRQLETIYRIVEESIALANDAILLKKDTDPSLVQMGTTVVLAVIWQDELVVANVGDSRAYLWQASGLTQYSRDHSVVQELLDSGSITPTEARQHQNRNRLTQAVGVEREITAEIRHRQLREDCVLLLCTDGLTEYLDEEKISLELETKRPLLEHCYRMIDTANRQGGKDNITIAVAEFAR